MSCYAEQKFLLASSWTPKPARGFVLQSCLFWQHLYGPGGQSQEVLESTCLFSARNPLWKSVTRPCHNNGTDLRINSGSMSHTADAIFHAVALCTPQDVK